MIGTIAHDQILTEMRLTISKVRLVRLGYCVVFKRKLYSGIIIFQKNH